MENGRGLQIQKFFARPSRNRGLRFLFPSGFPEIKERIRGTDLNFTSRDAAFCPDYSKKLLPEQTNEKNDEKIGASAATRLGATGPRGHDVICLWPPERQWSCDCSVFVIFSRH